MEYKIGQKVKYINSDGKESIGKIHGIQNHETPEGLIKDRFYLIDTGGIVREDVVEVDNKGKPTKTAIQPEQITLTENMLKVIR